MHGGIDRQYQGAGLQGAGVLQQFVGLVFADEHALGNGQQAFAQVGQAHRALVSVKQEDAEAFFEFAYLVGDCRLGEEQALGGAGEAAVLGHGVEGFQLCMGDRHCSTSNKLSLYLKYDKSISLISQ
ncbi:hypothetical protein D3C85_985020 [compost metagenome]